MDREPYLVLRDFRVWFPKRAGFLESLLKGDPGHVRAVDGIDLDVGRGEIFCLVGESGCGKTTTGKAILRLVEPTGGDVFVGEAASVLKEYEAAKARGDDEALERIRRRWSLSYRERTEARWTDVAFAVMAALSGGVLGLLVASAFVLAADLAGALGAGFLVGIPLGLVIGYMATLPPVRLSRRISQLHLLLGLGLAPLAFLVAGALRAWMSSAPSDLGAVGAALERSWQLYALLIVLAMPLGAWSAWFWSGYFTRRRLSRQGTQFEKIRKLRKILQIIFQDPYESLNPKHSVYDIVAEPLLVNRLTRSRAETEARVRQALDDAGLRPPEEFLFRFPHELSGGQRQRVSIAGALVLEPDFLVADEPVSMLDVSIRTEILELLLELRRKKGLTYLFITHDLSLAWVLADRIGVMYLGRIVEIGPTKEIVKNPRHPYTKALISVVPVPDPDRRHERIVLRGERPDPGNIPRGCRFHPRCPVAFERCGWAPEELLDDLREILLTHDPAKAPALQAARVEGPMSLLLPSGWDDRLRKEMADRAETFRSLKAVKSIEAVPEGVRVALHEFEDPLLREIAPGVQAACHLVV